MPTTLIHVLDQKLKKSWGYFIESQDIFEFSRILESCKYNLERIEDNDRIQYYIMIGGIEPRLIATTEFSSDNEYHDIWNINTKFYVSADPTLWFNEVEMKLRNMISNKSNLSVMIPNN